MEVPNLKTPYVALPSVIFPLDQRDPRVVKIE